MKSIRSVAIRFSLASGTFQRDCFFELKLLLMKLQSTAIVRVERMVCLRLLAFTRFLQPLRDTILKRYGQESEWPAAVKSLVRDVLTGAKDGESLALHKSTPEAMDMIPGTSAFPD